ncbi:unnamed protein product [Calicophoron daubneyi]
MCDFPCRVILFVINLVVGATGFLLLITGALLTWGRTVLAEQLRQIVGPLVGHLYGGDMSIKVNELAEIILRFTSPFGFLIFVFGCFIFIICIIGCSGACCQKASCLKVYTGLMFLVLVMQIMLMGFYYSNRPVILEMAQKLLNESLLHYQSIESDDVNSVLFNIMMPKLNCCGLYGGEDFRVSLSFNRTYDYEGRLIDLKYPVSCCKLDNMFNIIDDSCPLEFNERNSNVKRGCWDVLEPRLVHWTNVAALIGLCLTLLQVILIVLTVLSLFLRQW